MMRVLSRGQRLNDIRGTVRGASRKRQTPSPSTAEKIKRIDAPISPEMRPEAPTWAPAAVGLTARAARRPGRNKRKQREKRIAPTRCATAPPRGQQPRRVDVEVHAVPVHQHMSEERGRASGSLAPRELRGVAGVARRDVSAIANVSPHDFVFRQRQNGRRRTIPTGAKPRKHASLES